MKVMQGKRGLVLGVANDHSIAWGISEVLAAQGAELAFTYQGAAFEKRVRPLVEKVNGHILGDCDVTDDTSLDAVFENLGKLWDKIDFVVHAVAYSDKNELKGRYVDTTRANFLNTLDISCYSFTDIARRALPFLNEGASLLTLTYLGAERVVPNYNVMGIAKAALEASVRYLASDLGGQNMRVNAISAGPMRTLAGSAIGSARAMFSFNKRHAPLKRNVDLEEIGNAALFLLSPLGSGVTGEVMYVDAGYHNIGMPRPEDLEESDD
jgi:enoyl-[acyl-carrier protein] reductase I